MANRSQFGSLITPYIRKVYFDQYKDPSDTIATIFNVNTSDKAEEVDLGLNGIKYLTKTPEGASITYQEASEGYKTRYVNATYTAGMQVTREEWEDNQYLVKGKREANNLGRASRLSPIRDAMSVFVNAFSASAGDVARYGDAKALCATDHPSSTGGSAMSNRGFGGATNDPLFTYDNLESALVAFSEQTDDNGLPIVVDEGDIVLMVPKALERKAIEYTNSPNKPETADNGVNVYEGRFTVMSSPYIANFQGGSDTAWFLISKNYNMLNFFWRVKPEFEDDSEFDTKVQKYSVRGRWSFGYSDWRGVWGSDGTND